MSFSVFDADVGGNLVAGPLVFDGQGGNPPQISVASGLFTSTLDFGAGVFDGSSRWLEITVSGTTLSPRQPITSAPYAQRSIDAQSCNIANYANAPWVPSGSDLYYNAGNIGIGTSTPTAKLEVAGTPGVDGIKFPDGTIQLSATVGAAGFWSGSGANIFNNNAGNAGIGTSTPLAKLHLAGSMKINGSSTLEFGAGVPKETSAGKIGYQTYGNFDSLDIVGAGTTGANRKINFWNEGGATFKGNIGIGTVTPLSKLDITATGTGAELLRFTTERPWIFRQTYTGPSTGLELYSTSGIKTFEITAVGGTKIATFSANDADPQLIVNGKTTTKVLQITGADLAEKFPTSDCGAPGTVMEIDPENPGLLRTSACSYNQRVAGVISGANNFPAGAILGHLPGNEDAPPIALSGRVWTWCDATTSKIEPGDLLTTSSTPGHAMKAVDRDRSNGAVIGKAMTPLKSGLGLVLVLVNLQ
ncbi:MAG: hypothetical protein HZA51_02680 [Planctomycetes bacterium]|nr:hypothetical protein [Planctomycetota bacterium]